MNRKERRATLKHGPPGAARTADAGRQISKLFLDALAFERAGKLDEAARTYKRVVTLNADHAEAHNNLARVLHTQGKAKDASASYARALALMPQLFQQYPGIRDTLTSLLPQLDEALRRQIAAWPKRSSVTGLFGESGFAAIADNPLLLIVLQSTPVRDVAFERLLTALRASLANDATAGNPVAESILGLACTLARQCFINEYVFATTPEEEKNIDDLRRAIAGNSPRAMQIAALAMYVPLHTVPSASALLERKWNPHIEAVLTQQLREPAQEKELRDLIPHLTEIEDDVSKRVRQQYEENPYPRWVHVAGQVTSMPIDQYLRDSFQQPPSRRSARRAVSTCSSQAAAPARSRSDQYRNTWAHRHLRFDLSLSSLCYAKRKTPAELAARIDYAQADILKLGSIGRSFDVVDACGVLHHMADPLAGWRILLSLLRPGRPHASRVLQRCRPRRRCGLRARSSLNANSVRHPDDIRRCRQELLATPLASVTRFTDFFTTSECRDLLFHVHESRVTIPLIKDFIRENGLTFIGFEFDLPLLLRHRAQFAAAGWSLADLDRWQEVETSILILSPACTSSGCRRTEAPSRTKTARAVFSSHIKRRRRFANAVHRSRRDCSFELASPGDGARVRPAIRSLSVVRQLWRRCERLLELRISHLEQCRATVSGIGGFCAHNQFYNRGLALHTSARASISDLHAH
jgi:SAM-dependent methyltransferase